MAGKFAENFGSNFIQNPQYLQYMRSKEFKRPDNSIQKLEEDTDKWDLSSLTNIMIQFADDNRFYINDIEIDIKRGGTGKFKQRLREIKQTRNKFSHSEEVEAREVYEQVDNIQRFFQMFKSNLNNNISQNKARYAKHLNEQRLYILERLVREEQLK